MEKKSILITSPSINKSNNVSGIANLTDLIIQYNGEVDYYHFITGRKDGESRNFLWLFRQFILPFKFLICLIMNENISIYHFNVPQLDDTIMREGILILIAKLMRKKIIVHLRGGKHNKKEIKNVFVKMFFRILLISSDKIICLSEVEKTFIIQHYHINFIKIWVLPNAVKDSVGEFKKDYNGILNILFLGRIDKDKGLKEIITVLKNIYDEIDFEFLLCGAGPHKNYIIEELSKTIPNAFVDCGIVSDHEKDNILGKSHIFLLPSYYEGLPNAMLEAMAYGVVPICTPVGSVPSVIKDKENGFLVPMYNSNAIKKILITLNSDRKNLEQIGKTGYQCIKEEYSLSKYISTLNKIYLDL
jgi:glycosyltransferase involved in cell wall biosynthesis